MHSVAQKINKIIKLFRDRKRRKMQNGYCIVFNKNNGDFIVISPINVVKIKMGDFFQQKNVVKLYFHSTTKSRFTSAGLQLMG